MNVIIDIITILISIIILKKFVRLKKNSIYIALIIFYIAYVLPILLNLILGNPHFSYYGFAIALDDSLTSTVYDVFVVLTECLFYNYIKRNQNKVKNKKNSIAHFNREREKISKNGILILLFCFLSIIPIFVLLMAPDFKQYISNLGAIIGNENSYTESVIAYKENIAKWAYFIGALGVIGLKFSDIKNNTLLKIIRIFSIIAIALLNGKRTFITFVILLLLFIDLISNQNKRKKIFNTLLTAIIIVSYFVLYSYVTGKYEFNTDWYSVLNEYFFRGNTTKVAIYSVLNPDKLKILDYTGQSMIYNLLYFIPRTMWNNKPYQYAIYFTSATRGIYNIKLLVWYFQVGFYGEMISNFGLLGIVLGPLFLLYLAKKVDNTENIFVNIIGVFFISFIQVFEYSDMFKIIFAFLIFFYLKSKIKFKKNTIMVKSYEENN